MFAKLNKERKRKKVKVAFSDDGISNQTSCKQEMHWLGKAITSEGDIWHARYA